MPNLAGVVNSVDQKYYAYNGVNNTRPSEFSFADVSANIVLPFHLPGNTSSPMVSIPGLTILSFSTHQDVYPVVSFGNKGIKGFCYGHTIFSGTLGFIMLGGNPFTDAIAKYSEWIGTGQNLQFYTPHDLPPFDMNINMVNEKGDSVYLLIRSMVIVDSGSNVSTQDIRFTDTYSFICSKITPIINILSKPAETVTEISPNTDFFTNTTYEFQNLVAAPEVIYPSE